MSNFEFLKKEVQFKDFSDIAITAEKSLSIDPATCAINCRRTIERAIKWMYSIDGDLKKPYQDKLHTLMSTDEFKDIVDEDLWKRIDFIRSCGNTAAHSDKKITDDMAKLCIENLFYFMDFIAYCYADNYEEVVFDKSLLEVKSNVVSYQPIYQDLDIEQLIKENEQLKDELTQRREQQSKSYTFKSSNLTEFDTRKTYIDYMLTDAGWTEGKDWINEVEVFGMPNKSETGYVDYVLYDDAHVPLALIEAKRTCVDVVKGRQQAILYANLLEKKYKRRPVIFLSNGFDTRIIDNQYPERIVSSIYSKRDLEKLFNLQRNKESLKNVSVNENIAGRYYQIGAIKAVCEALDTKNKRKSLLVMATGSGKTRTVIGLVDVLLKKGWIKNILFLADRNSLVTQAKRSFVNLLPNYSVTNLVEEKNNYTAHGVFSTYQTMIHCIDTVKNEDIKLFTPGHFDLIVCDEVHRSIYNKYKDILNYFDAPLVGLTATPKDEIDKNTYSIFDLESGVPTYGYELAQAVEDGYLVDFISVETSLKFMEEGIIYDELTDEEKEEYENTFADEDGEVPELINSSALNTWVFNEDTIKKVLSIFMENGIKINYGQKIGKSIIFAKNHKHAEKIFEIFNKQYPHLNGYAKVIDNVQNYAQSIIDEFSDPIKLPQIAISVDMMDTGIDVPEVVNLVFFKKVMSKAKFWQMIGRGTRLCPGLLDGADKNKFYIFDFCGNFEFFRMNKERITANTMSVQCAIFNMMFQLVYKLQDIQFQTDELIAYRKKLIGIMVDKVKELDTDNFVVRQHIKYVDLYSKHENYEALTYENTLEVNEELSILIMPDNDEVTAIRFDALMYGLELAYVTAKKYSRAKNDLIKKVKAISKVAHIDEVKQQSELINKILSTDYLETCDIKGFELIRENLRDLIKYISPSSRNYSTNYEDNILGTYWNESDLDSEDLKNYKAKVEYYIRQNQHESVIAKLKSNIPLSESDVNKLENIVWNELGSKEEYIHEYGEKPLGEFVREIVGLEMNAVKEAFAIYLNEEKLNSNQIYFVNQIIEYIAKNGLMKDLSVLKESPFSNRGSVADVFANDMPLWNNIRNVIAQINNNALYA